MFLQRSTYLDPQASNEQYSLFDIDGFTKFLIRILLSASELCSDINIRLADEFIKNYPPVMHIFLKFLQDVFACATDYPRFRLLKAVASAILSIAWNLSDKTPFVPLFVKTGYVEAAIKWLGTSLLHFTTQSGNPVISLIHNISRHKEGLRELRKNSAFQALIVWKSDIEKTNIERLKLTFGMVLIRLAKSETEQKDNEDVIRTVSTALFDRSKEAAKQSNWEYDGYHLSELLDPLQHTYANAFVVQPIMDKKTDSIQFFVELFTSVYGILLNQEADDREKLIGKSLMKILLCISNDKQGREVFNNDHAFCVLAESLAKRQKQDIAKRIWANLQTFNTTTTLQNQPKRERQPMIYINYNWANIRFCRRFITNLRTFTKIDIWVDHEKVDSSDDMWDHLADIINSATLIIILVSNAYCNSVYNHQELNYVMAKVHTRHEERSVMAVAAEDNFTFSTVLTKSMNKKKPDVSFNQDISVMALETITLSKNHSLIPGPPGNTIHSRVCTII